MDRQVDPHVENVLDGRATIYLRMTIYGAASLYAVTRACPFRSMVQHLLRWSTRSGRRSSFRRSDKNRRALLRTGCVVSLFVLTNKPMKLIIVENKNNQYPPKKIAYSRVCHIPSNSPS